MKRLGSVLMVMGVIIAFVFALDFRVNEAPFFAALGLEKLSFLSAVGFLGTGAFLRRIAIRGEKRRLASLARHNEEL
ncbi:hypothetical protein D3C83_137010 [compost metagenome]